MTLCQGEFCSVQRQYSGLGTNDESMGNHLTMVNLQHRRALIWCVRIIPVFGADAYFVNLQG